MISALALGISEGKMENLLYIPLSFACWLAPVFVIFYAWTGFFTPTAEETGEVAPDAAQRPAE